MLSLFIPSHSPSHRLRASRQRLRVHFANDLKRSNIELDSDQEDNSGNEGSNIHPPAAVVVAVFAAAAAPSDSSLPISAAAVSNSNGKATALSITLDDDDERRKCDHDSISAQQVPEPVMIERSTLDRKNGNDELTFSNSSTPMVDVPSVSDLLQPDDLRLNLSTSPSSPSGAASLAPTRRSHRATQSTDYRRR